MKQVYINVAKEINRILPENLRKDLTNNERICTMCHGLGIISRDNIFGIKDDISESAKKSRFPYKHQSLFPCPNCYNGVVSVCEFCGKQLNRGRTKCNCEKQQEIDEQERRAKYQETINKAKEISLKDAEYYIYDEKSGEFFSDEDEFVEYYWGIYLDGDVGHIDFDEYFEYEVPKVLWNCSKVEIIIDAKDIITNACENLHENAYDNISQSDIGELQDYLDEWCKKQTGTTTYYPCYKEYVKVQKEWFE